MPALKKKEPVLEEEQIMDSIEDVHYMLQQKLKAPKNQYNSFGKYKYRSAEDILQGVKAIMPEGGALVCSDEIILVGDWHYVKAVAVLSWGGASVQATGNAREPETKKGMDASQITGTASSYARKYALNGLFGIDDTKDADTNEHQETQNNAPAEPEPVTVCKSVEWREEFKEKAISAMSNAGSILDLQGVHEKLNGWLVKFEESEFQCDIEAAALMRVAYEANEMRCESIEKLAMGGKNDLD